MKKIVSIYKSSVVDQMYLYVDKKEGLSRLPEKLREMFGRQIHVSDMLMTDSKKLARANADKVLAEIKEKGFYLQMPPQKEPYLLDLFKDTSERYKGLE